MSLSIYLEGQVCEHCGKGDDAIFERNITHNLVPMAREADIYLPLWQAKDEGISKASQLIGPLQKAYAAMCNDPERFKRHNPPNGWGSLETFLLAIKSLLDACVKNSTANFTANG